jgi:poly [ADP-ribose] polymerase
MATLVRTVYLVKSDPVKNNNKFWKGTEFDNGDVLCEWGRVGDSGQSKLFSGVGGSFLDKKANEKKRDGRNGEIAYRELNIIDANTNKTSNVNKPITSSISSPSLAAIAKKQIKYNDPQVAKLIDDLSRENIHNITSISNNRITYNYDSGVFQTAMGIVGQETIDEARSVLGEIGDLVTATNYGNTLMDLTRTFLMLIPQDTGRTRLELPVFWSDMSKVKQQNDILDGLQSSLVKVTNGKVKAVQNDNKIIEEEKVFDTTLETVTDPKEIKRLFGYYYDTRHTMHSCYHYTPIAIWKVDIKSMREAFVDDGAKMKCVVSGFHGSATANTLSLLKTGMLVRPPKNAAIAGALFGPGIYCAPLFREDKSLIKGAGTKALGYSTGYWGGTKASRTFMFIVDMAMGKYYIPKASTYMSTRYPVNGYESTWAYGNESGVRNDEAIVYRSSQVNIRYLMELKS